jgi:lipopolysaccharide transport system ATP-binding protein
VLAVGDAEFQRKCLGKMGDVAHAGRTVLFVSHNMAAVRGLCSRSLLLRQGRVEIDGSSDRVIAAYLADVGAGSGDKRSWSYRHRGARVAIEDVEVLVDGAAAAAVQSGDEVTFRIGYRALVPEVIGEELSMSVELYAEGQRVANLWTNFHSGRGLPIAPRGHLACTLPRWPFRNAPFRVDVYTHIGPDTQDWIQECASFTSHDGDYYGSGFITNPDQGILFLDHRWSAGRPGDA